MEADQFFDKMLHGTTGSTEWKYAYVDENKNYHWGKREDQTSMTFKFPKWNGHALSIMQHSRYTEFYDPLIGPGHEDQCPAIESSTSTADAAVNAAFDEMERRYGNRF